MKVELRKKSALATSDSPVKAVEALVTKCRYLKVAELQVAGRSGNTRANAAVSFPDVVEILTPTENHKKNRCGKKVLRKAGASLRQLNPMKIHVTGTLNLKTCLAKQVLDCTSLESANTTVSHYVNLHCCLTV